ncbi:Lipase 3 [Hypsizygus marmoreus]|uniref:Carboxylic ester hydrolase n=1 Tax=Hypsizygus marmoreus TaxID=39966 RepID=A0A369K499_HYPMA|nr:Lipase 3 [Hypsizygus marmoreus]
MPVIQKPRYHPVPKLYLAALQTTFCGINHPLSTPDAPIHQYLGIKYASVPARFRQSKLQRSYPPLVDASAHGPICPQPNHTKSVEEELFGLADEDIPKQLLKHDEFECLNLNITCPAGLTPQSRVPVMLWIHGGGDRGSGSSWMYDAGPLVRKSLHIGKLVIIVTCNFRLGLFGFAASHMIREDNEAAGDEGVGNYGLRDQRKAMEWLHHHIGDFGGDPGNITIFGESSGGADIVCHLLSADNQSRPMFQRAIVQSAILEHNFPDTANAGWHLSRILSALHISNLEQLRSIDAEKLANISISIRAIDDDVFFRQGWKDFFVKEDAHTRHHFLHIKDHLRRASRSRSCLRGVRSPALALPANLQPLIIGDSASDSTLWSLAVSLWTAPAAVRRIKAVCQSLTKASSVLRAYDISTYTPDEEIMDRVLELVNDARVAWPTECVAQNAKRERGGHGVWRYVFDQEGPSRGVPHHAADLIYLWDTVPLPASAQPSSSCSANFCDGPFEDSDDEDLGYPPVIREDEEWTTTVVDEWAYARVRDTMQERWISFAHGEAPWKEDKVFVFGPEGETGERSSCIFEGRRRKEMWREALEPLGMQLVQKVGMELSRGPPLPVGPEKCRF